MHSNIFILRKIIKHTKRRCILKANRVMKTEINEVLKVLREGGIILYPTDTIWGLGCDATNPEAVARIYAIKQRTDSKALITLVDSIAKVQGYVEFVPDVAWDLTDVADKPLTIIYSKGKNLAPNLLAEDGSVGIRITHETFSHLLCQRFKLPIVSTSANVSGQPAPQNFNEISEDILHAVDYVVKYRQDDTSKAAPSSILKLGDQGEIQIIR